MHNHAVLIATNHKIALGSAISRAKPFPFRQYHDQTDARTIHNPPLPYLRGMKREEWVAPIPGRPCLTGLLWKLSETVLSFRVEEHKEVTYYEIENSAK